MEVARVEGVEATARGLGLRRSGLARRLAEAEADGAVADGSASVVRREGGDAGGYRFVELDTGALRGSAGMIVELAGCDGERLRIEAEDARALDVVSITRAFLGRSR